MSNSNNTMEAAIQAGNEQTATGASRELLTFTLGSDEYGIDFLKVQEIRGGSAEK